MTSEDLLKTLVRHDEELQRLREQVATITLELENRVTPQVERHGDRLDDHASQLARLAAVPARLDSIWMRLDRLEQGQGDADRSLRSISVSLAHNSDELRTAREESRHGIEFVKNLLLERLAPREILPPSVEAEGLRAKLSGLEAQLAAASRERDDLRQRLKELTHG